MQHSGIDHNAFADLKKSIPKSYHCDVKQTYITIINAFMHYSGIDHNSFRLLI